MASPNYKPTQGANIHTAPETGQNNLKPSVPRTHSPFDMSNIHYRTQAYGRIEPYSCLPVVAGDRIQMSDRLTVHSNPFKSQMLTKLFVKKCNFYVPWTSILPFGWDYFYKQPAQGDDVPEDVNCTIPEFRSYVKSMFGIYKTLATSTSLVLSNLNIMVKLLFMLDDYLSAGSLISSLGYRLVPRIFISGVDTNDLTIDAILNSCYESLFPAGLKASVTLASSGNTTTFIQIVGGPGAITSGTIQCTRSVFLDILRQAYSFTISEWPATKIDANPSFIVGNGQTIKLNAITIGFNANPEDTDYLNIGALVAYQQACHQFFVNNKVDYVYDAELYRQLFRTALSEHLGGDISDSYTYNGIRIPYDYFSEHYLSQCFTVFSDSARAAALYDIHEAIFSYNYSLKFGDYFVGARTRPLSVGSDQFPGGQGDVIVNDNKVSAIDMAKSLVFQRFRNAVIKIGNSVDDYRKTMTGEATPPDFHYPKFISAQDTEVDAYNIENTTSIDSGDVVSRLSTTGSDYEYSLDIDLDGFVISMSYFFVPRTYSRTKYKWFFHRDRFDMFQPMLQNIGDQPIRQIERNDVGAGIFAYTNNNEEYKQNYSIANGAFTSELRSWLFISDEISPESNNGDEMIPLSPYYIRCKPSEFDRFLLNPVGYTHALRYHFICTYMNSCQSLRPMIPQPTLL